MLEERTLLLSRFVWLHLAAYLKTGAFAPTTRLLSEYNVTKEAPGMQMNGASLQRMCRFSQFVAKEYVKAYPKPTHLETATRAIASSIGIGFAAEEIERLGEEIYADMRAAVERNGIHKDLPSAHT